MHENCKEIFDTYTDRKLNTNRIYLCMFYTHMFCWCNDLILTLLTLSILYKLWYENSVLWLYLYEYSRPIECKSYISIAVLVSVTRHFLFNLSYSLICVVPNWFTRSIGPIPYQLSVAWRRLSKINERNSAKTLEWLKEKDYHNGRRGFLNVYQIIYVLIPLVGYETHTKKCERAWFLVKNVFSIYTCTNKYRNNLK